MPRGKKKIAALAKRRAIRRVALLRGGQRLGQGAYGCVHDEEHVDADSVRLTPFGAPSPARLPATFAVKLFTKPGAYRAERAAIEALLRSDEAREVMPRYFGYSDGVELHGSGDAEMLKALGMGAAHPCSSGPAIFMEKLDASLQSIIDGGRFELLNDRAISEFASKVAGLREHVHCDVKPDNIMLRGDGSWVLVDWNLSQRASEMAPDESIGCTPFYACPFVYANGEDAEDSINAFRAMVHSPKNRFAAIVDAINRDVMTGDASFGLYVEQLIAKMLAFVARFKDTSPAERARHYTFLDRYSLAITLVELRTALQARGAPRKYPALEPPRIRALLDFDGVLDSVPALPADLRITLVSRRRSGKSSSARASSARASFRQSQQDMLRALGML